MLRIIVLTTFTMIAFAANSVLTRLALAPEPPLIDALSFATLRIISGGCILWVILFLKKVKLSKTKPDWKSALALLVYVLGFSFSYLSLSAGTGALILFGTVQITMFAFAIYEGERFSLLGWLGLLSAVGGITYLLAPGVSAPSLLGTLLMIIAGVGWGVYSLLGRHVVNPLQATAWSFSLCIPFVLLAHVLFVFDFSATQEGIALALASGALASGLGYMIWYAVLPSLSAGKAASVQLSVPIIAALGGALLLFEPITLRMIIAAALTLSGIALVLFQRDRL